MTLEGHVQPTLKHITIIWVIVKIPATAHHQRLQYYIEHDHAEIDIEIGGGNTIIAVITEVSAKSLGIQEGAHACAIFKASSVIIGVK